MTLLLLQSGPASAAAAPVNTVLPVISGTAQVGQTLTTTNGTWTGTPTSYGYQWKSGGVNISGATASTYLLVTADLAATITVTVTATNVGGSTSATATGVGPIAAVPLTWDPATIAAVTLSGGNLVVTSTSTSTNQGARVAASSAKSSGKYYFEMTITTAAGGGNSGFGVATTASTYANMGNNGSFGDEVFTNGAIFANGAYASIDIASFANGAVYAAAIDLDNRKAWFKKVSAPAGNWNNNASFNPATNTGGVTVPAGAVAPLCTFNLTGNVYSANFGASAYTGAVPSGFTSGWPA